jgi:hypothetical protein
VWSPSQRTNDLWVALSDKVYDDGVKRGDHSSRVKGGMTLKEAVNDFYKLKIKIREEILLSNAVFAKQGGHKNQQL